VRNAKRNPLAVKSPLWTNLSFARRSMPYELKILMWNVSTFLTKFDVEKAADDRLPITKRIETEVLTPSFPFPPGLLFANDGCEAQSIRERVISWRAKSQ